MTKRELAKIQEAVEDMNFTDINKFAEKYIKVAKPDKGITKEQAEDILHKSAIVFTGGQYEVLTYPHTKSKVDLFNLANYIQGVLGEYNYYSARNICYVTLAEAVDKEYLYDIRGRARQMNKNAILEWVYVLHPELDNEMHLEEAKAKSQELLESKNIYPFYKYDTVDVNVHRRLRKAGCPIQYLAKNIRGLSKAKNGHLQGEEDKTRMHLSNTYKALYSLWQQGYCPIIQPRGVEELPENLQQAAIESMPL